MNIPVDHTTLHRTAKYFMDSGKANSHAEAMAMLESFGLSIYVGREIARSVAQQTALLTLVNLAHRTLLGGIEVVGVPDAASITPLAPGRTLSAAIRNFGGTPVATANPAWPSALIGAVNAPTTTAPQFRLTWDGWRGGVTSARFDRRLGEKGNNTLAPALAAALCVSEVFSYFAGDNPLAGRRSSGLSLWRPGAEWLQPDTSEPQLAYLPSHLWLIGLGNLGQAYGWLLASLPYQDRSKIQLVLQDFDRIASSNESTSVLSFARDVGVRKTRVVASWLEARGFDSYADELRFGPATRRAANEPGAALCGFDNAEARTYLEDAGFGLIVESGLGGGPQGFRSLSVHSFPASRKAKDIWSKVETGGGEDFSSMPAYDDLKLQGADDCGLATLASRSVGVPFVGMIAGCLVVAEILRRLHGGVALEYAACSALSLDDIESGACTTSPYAWGHAPVAPADASDQSAPDREGASILPA